MMNKNIKFVLLIAGAITLVFGINSIEIEEEKNNTKAYITIGFGIVAIALSLVKGIS